jgi:phosphohistidine phosphatase
LLVGHNPGLHQLVLELTADDEEGLRRQVEDKLPTAAVALIELPALRWDETVAGSGTIRELILPRELKD